MSEPQKFNNIKGWSGMELIQAALFLGFLGTPAFFWWAFITIVVGLLVFDLGFLHKGQKEIEAKESFLLYAGYVAIAFAFGRWVWWARGGQSGLEFFTGNLIEQSLAMDNIFVIATVFTFLGIPASLSTGAVLGHPRVIVFRAILIGLGAALVMSFSWILFVFWRLPGLHGPQDVQDLEREADVEDNMILR